MTIAKFCIHVVWIDRIAVNPMSVQASAWRGSRGAEPLSDVGGGLGETQ